jgi:hypothetical protein
MLSLFALVNSIISIIGLVLLVAVLGLTGDANMCFTANGKSAA